MRRIGSERVPIFDGRQRVDLSLTFERVEAEGGAPISADAILCRVRYEPIAGHRAGRRTIRNLRENRDMEIGFARLPGREVMAPVRILVGTPLGALVSKADRFVAAPAP